MGEAQKLPWQELLVQAREHYDAGTDFTLAVEEEFAILDPVTLELVNRFEDLQATARGTELARASVLDCVHHRFLGNVIKLGGRCCVTDVDSVIAIERARNSKSFANVCGQTIQRDVQSISFKFR